MEDQLPGVITRDFLLVRCGPDNWITVNVNDNGGVAKYGLFCNCIVTVMKKCYNKVWRLIKRIIKEQISHPTLSKIVNMFECYKNVPYSCDYAQDNFFFQTDTK